MNVKRTLLATAAVVGLATLGTTGANATPIDTSAFNLGGFTGTVDIKFHGFTAENPGTVGTGPNGGSGGKETTFGAGYIDSIIPDGGSTPVWASGQAHQTLSYMLYGIADASITGGPPPANNPFVINNVGASSGPFAGADGKIHLDLYLDNTTAAGGTNPDFVGAAGAKASDRNAVNKFGGNGAGLTDGVLFMSIEFTPGIIPGDGTTLMQQTASSNTLPATGSGAFDAECVSGPGCSFFTDPSGPDFLGQFTLKTVSAALQANGWQGDTFDPITANVIPEPGTVVVLGFSLVGLAGALRRRTRETRA
jgi:hypothetical protein